MGQSPSKGAGRALAQERLRAEIGVKLHMAIGDKGSHRAVLEEAFRRADGDGDGTITFEEFGTAAASIGLGVSEAELRKAFDRFDVNRDRTIEFDEVVNFMCPRIVTHRDRQAAAQTEALERLATNRTELTVDDHVSSAVQKVAQSVYDKELNVRRAFQTWDGNGSGDLDIAEFTNALNALGFSLDLVDAKSLFKFFDIDGDGRIKCWEFVRTLSQFEADLSDGPPPPTHNTGRGGGGDANDPSLMSNRGGGGHPSPDKIGSANGGATMQSSRSKMMEKSRAQKEAEAKRAEEATRAAAAAAQREQELASALAAVELQRAALAKEHERIASEAERAALAQYQELQRQLVESSFDSSKPAHDAAAAAALRQQMAEQQAAIELARAQAEAEAAKGPDLFGWLGGGGGGAPDISDGGGAGGGGGGGGGGKSMDVKDKGSVSDVLNSGLSRFAHPISDTDTYQKGIYAWQASVIDETLEDDAILRALAQRLKYVHTTAGQALAQVVKEPNVAKNPNAFGEHGVDGAVFKAFAASLLYKISPSRCEQLLARKSGKNVPMINVPKFLSLFAHGGPQAKVEAPPLSERIKGRHVDKLSGREQKLLLTMRDYLFEQHGRMQNMFKRCDPDGSGAVTIEEFLNAMRRAGIAVGHGLDRKSDNSISEEEACNIVGFFDQDGDGHLRYSEFMTMLQSTKNSVLTQKVLTQRGMGPENSGRQIY